ncbi:Rgp1 [Necator americanus]|uniref:Rgp1 n=1 Tax=Necator americanus TaxID=51031 RepID=W2TRT5_NECAM|nr:Rgp1 [Necator americanus]ETN83821.1 Rgp1 [Necator americanus]
MPLEVAALLDRDVAIYLTGEVITVKVTLRNLAPKGRESLAWGSVQLTCERTLGAQVAFRDRPTTAISRSASTVYSSKPNVLFCDVELSHGESRQFTIIPSVGVDENPKTEQNPFSIGSMVPATISQTVIAAVDEITAPKRAYMFNSDVPCVQYSVHLETVEQLAEDVVGEHGEVKSEGMVGLFFNSIKLCDVWLKMNVAVHSNDYVVCAFASDSSFRLSIPMHASPTFHTETVHLKWRLRFEFVTSEPLINVVYGEVCKAPIDVPIETLAWKVDIYVLPCSPQNAALTDSSHVGSASMVL